MIFKLRKSRINLSYDDSKKKLQKYFMLFGSLCLLHMILFYSFEGGSLFQSLWVTVISMTTVGYGDVSAETMAGQTSTMILVGLGIFVLANLADHFMSFRADKRIAQRMGSFFWNLENHVVIANIPKNYTNEDVINLIQSLKKEMGEEKVFQILTNRFKNEQLPDDIFALGNVVYYNGLPSRTKSLEAVNIALASDVILLSLYDDNDPDGFSFDVIHRIRDLNGNVNILVQCQNFENKQRLLKAGANTVVKPVRAYPEMIAHAVKNGSVVVNLFDDLMSKEGDELLRIKLEKPFNIKWSDAIVKLMNSKRGLPLGYVNKKGEMKIKPNLDEIVEIQELIMLEYSDSDHSVRIENVLEA